MPSQTFQLIPQFSNPRFLTLSKLDIFAEEQPNSKQGLAASKTHQNRRKKRKMERYAAYLRVSSEEQIGNFSIDAQRRAIQTWVQARGGRLVKIYVDEGKSARTSERPAFVQMRRDARKGKFDALVVHKFDRFARNRTDALAIKSLLRYDYGVKVFSVTEPSEDSDGPLGALIEGIMESVADWYSRNLAAETAKGKKERGQQGFHNNQAPFGYTKNEEKILIPDERELPGLLMAFQAYATGKFSDNDVACMLNERGFHTKTGRPFSKETVRDMLQNRTYLGEVRYQKYQRNADGSRSHAAPTQWFEGQHEAIISIELFDHCQEMRAKRLTHRQATPKYHPYLLRNLIYCHRCCEHPPENPFPSYGKMRPQYRGQRDNRAYRCRAREMGYQCEQSAVPVEVIDAQVVGILMHLKPPADWKRGITQAMSEFLGDKNLEQRLAEIREAIRRMDFRWDNGFITDEHDYMEKRVQLQQELEQLTPVEDDDLETAAELLENFGKHWEACAGDPEAQHELIKVIVERVYVRDRQVAAMTLRSNYHLVLGHDVKEPTEVSVSSWYTSGDDGIRTRDLGLDRAAC